MFKAEKALLVILSITGLKFVIPFNKVISLHLGLFCKLVFVVFPVSMHGNSVSELPNPPCPHMDGQVSCLSPETCPARSLQDH